MAVNELLRSSSLSWLAASGKDSDVVLSSRVRLARNFKEIPFPNRADFNQLAAVRLQAEKLLPGIAADLGQAFDLLDLERITPLQRDVLIEKQLISRNFIQNPQHRIAFITADRATSIMVNEEDHLRIQCMAPGLDLDTPFARASHIDDMVESQVDIAFDEKMGYLTSCPTNLGTGLRASVLLHLPGLVFTRNIQSIMNISPQLGLAIRSVYGDETESVGNLFQISNQLTLGFSEHEILENLKTAVMEIVSHERQARKALALYMKERLEDEVWRSYGTLRYNEPDGNYARFNIYTSKTLPLPFLYRKSKQREAVTATELTLGETEITASVADGHIALKPTLKPATVTDRRIVWTSSNESVATVNGGFVTLLSEGETTINARTADGGAQTSVRLIVSAASGISNAATAKGASGTYKMLDGKSVIIVKGSKSYTTDGTRR